MQYYSGVFEMFKGDSDIISFLAELPPEESLAGWDFTAYFRSTLTAPVLFELSLKADQLSVIKVDGNFIKISLPISSAYTMDFSGASMYVTVKMFKEQITKTIANIVIHFKTFMHDFYVNEYRQYVKDMPGLNTGEFLNITENSESDISRYLQLSVDSYNDSYYKTEHTIDTFPSKPLLYKGALVQSLVSNGIISARCALTYQDSSGIVIQDMDRYGRYTNLLNMFYETWKREVMDVKRSANIEACYASIPGDMGYGHRFDRNYSVSLASSLSGAGGMTL